MNLRITPKLLEKLQRLLQGETLPYSQLNTDLVGLLLAEGALRLIVHGQKRSVRIANRDVFMHCLSEIDESLSNLAGLKSIIEGTTVLDRNSLVQNFGNSKSIECNSCFGFFINSYDKIECTLANSPFLLPPLLGTYLYVYDWEHFSIPEDVLVIGVENMENFRRIAEHGDLFEKQLRAEESSIIFVSRYPQSVALRSWLARIPNRYVHFGDFDLAGISIFLNEFHKHLPQRSSFLIPEDINDRLLKGSHERYDDQYARYHSISSTDPALQSLIASINYSRRGYDQEGYILN